MGWATQITTIAMEMVVPAILGWWLDQRFGTRPVLVTVGGAIGLLSGLVHLLRVAKSAGNRQDPQARNGHQDRES
ncbi:MAG: AtpZ/AtpI family protein [Thermoguttaceae bacterium]|jgi:F0F1-type ATP synthase assembly protein I|nr:AtpZ/AtpI family protein [Thermoguttaceae bacterium]